MDQVISYRHGGSTDPDNLAFACLFCNRYKGTNVASIDAAGVLVRLFDPRRDRWHSHFRLEGAVILPLTAEGMARARLLRLNAAERVTERRLLQRLGAIPAIVNFAEAATRKHVVRRLGQLAENPYDPRISVFLSGVECPNPAFSSAEAITLKLPEVRKGKAHSLALRWFAF